MFRLNKSIVCIWLICLLVVPMSLHANEQMTAGVKSATDAPRYKHGSGGEGRLYIEG